MRPELEQIAYIEKYLQQKLTPEELTQFEEKMAKDVNFKKEVIAQQKITKASYNQGLKKKINRAKRKYTSKKWLKLIGIGTGLVCVGLLVAKMLLTTPPPSTSQIIDELPTTKHQIPVAQDTVLESENGILFGIPKDAFLDQDNNPVSGKIDIIIQEATTPSAIIKAGLSTYSNDDLLETGGMFYLEAYQGDSPLHLKTDKEISFIVPTDKVDPDMMLYKGEEKDGRINWVDPKPLIKTLETVDILSLNFYPHHFEEKLHELGIQDSTKTLRDSIFYTFYCPYNYALRGDENVDIYTVQDTDSSAPTDHHHGHHEHRASCHFIEPAHIKTIWNKHYQNTFIATKAFEERLQMMYQNCASDVLNLYLNNLNEPLYVVDQKAALICQPQFKTQFESFAQRKDGRVTLKKGMAQQLEHYFQKRSLAYRQAIEKTQRNYWKKQDKLDKKHDEKSQQKTKKDKRIEQKNFECEFCTNMKSTCHQLKIKQYPCDCKKPEKPLKNAYRGTINTVFIWNNIDKQVCAATIARKTSTIKWEGKEAKLTYHPIEVTIENEKQMDFTRVYLLSDSLKSYMRLKKKETLYTESLNSLMKYHLVVVGYQKNEVYLYHQVLPNQTGKYTISLVMSSKKNVKELLNKITAHQAVQDIKDDLNFAKYDYKDNIRIADNKKRLKLFHELRQVIFPCYVPPTEGETSGTLKLYEYEE